MGEGLAPEYATKSPSFDLNICVFENETMIMDEEIYFSGKSL